MGRVPCQEKTAMWSRVSLCSSDGWPICRFNQDLVDVDLEWLAHSTNNTVDGLLVRKCESVITRSEEVVVCPGISFVLCNETTAQRVTTGCRVTGEESVPEVPLPLKTGQIPGLEVHDSDRAMPKISCA